MGAQEEVVLRIRGIMETGDIRSAVKEIEGYFGKMNLSKSMKGEFDGIFDKLLKEVDNFEEKAQSSFKKASDVSALEKSAGKIEGLFGKIIQNMSKLDGMDIEDLINIDTSEIKKISDEIEKLEKKIKGLTSQKLDFGADAFKGISKSGQIGAFFKNFESGKIDQAGVSLKALQQNVLAFGTSIQGSADDVKKAEEAMQRYAEALQSGDFDKIRTAILNLDQALQKTGDTSNLTKFVNKVNSMTQAWAETKDEVKQTSAEISHLEVQKVEALSNATERAAREWEEMKTSVKGTSENVRGYVSAATSAASRTSELNREMDEIKNRVKYFLSLENAVDLFRQGVQKAFETVKELDKAMTETAVVTNFSVGDMWDQLPKYSQMAKDLGVSMQGVYEASTLYYQQGLKQEEVMALTNETLKMARIAGLECADATDLMTAALRGFNMEINETSAQRVNDVYSELAAITAADTNEIATAMTKTASIANSANMELETTAALLAQMIETTREPAETAGTAMKTIIARFTEMKKATSDIINVDGEEVSVNKVEDALKSAGVALRDTNGQFRNLDDVFLDLSKKWDSLDLMTQRYIATTAAGSRQQSRFIAMMQDYDRTMELVDAAYNSAGASSAQFGKTQDSLESKLANLKTAWQEFLMGIANSDAIKGLVDALTGFLNILNKASTGVGGFSTFVLRMFTVITTLKVGKGIFNNLFSGIGAQMMSGGSQAGVKFGQGLKVGIDQSSSTLGGSLKKLPQALKNDLTLLFKGGNFKKAFRNLSKDMEDSISGTDLTKSLEKSLSPEKIQSKASQLGEIMEQSLATSLDANNLTDEGQKWASGLIESFVGSVQSGQTTATAAVGQMQSEIANKLYSSEGSALFKNGQKGQAKAATNLGLNNTQTGGKTSKTSNIQIPKETVENAGKFQMSMEAAGMAISGAGMVINLVTSGLEEAGVISKEMAKGIETFSSGLSTTGTMLMTLTSIQKMFNITTAANPYIAAAAIIIGIITAVGSAIGQAAEKQKEMNQNTVDAANKSAEELEAVNEEVEAYDELLKVYKENGEETEELKNAKEELIDTLDLEKHGVNALTSSYEEVAEAAHKARMEMLEADKEKQREGMQSATNLAYTAGKKPASEGAGWTGVSSFGIALDRQDSYEELSGLLQDAAKEYGLEGLSFTKNAFGNMEINGLPSTPEGRQTWLKLMLEVMTKYSQDRQNSQATESFSTFWSAVSSYYEQGEGVSEQSKETEKAMAQETATGIAMEQSVTDMASFGTAVQNITNALEGFDLTEEEKISIALDTLQAEDPGLTQYANAYLSLLRSGLDSTNGELLNFISELDQREVELIGTIAFDEHDTKEQIQKILNEAMVVDDLFGSTARMSNLSNYSQKLVSGEEISEEDEANMLAYITNDYGAVAARQWELMSDSGVSTKLEFLDALAVQKRDESTLVRKEYMDQFDDQIYKDLEYFESGDYDRDVKVRDTADAILDAVKTDTKDGGNISDGTLTMIKNFEAGKDKDGNVISGFTFTKDGGWTASQHATSYNNTSQWSEERIEGQKEYEDLDLSYEEEYTTVGFSAYDQQGNPMPGSNIYDWVRTYNSPQDHAKAQELIRENGEDYYSISAEQMRKDNANKNSQLASVNYDIEHAATGARSNLGTYENSAARVLHEFGVSSTGTTQDYNKDGEVDFYDARAQLQNVEVGVKGAQAYKGLRSNESLWTDGQLISSEEYASIEDHNETILQQIKDIEEATEQGFSFEVKTDNKELDETEVKIKQTAEDGETIETEVVVNDEQLEDLEATLDDLDEKMITIEAEIVEKDIEAAAYALDTATARAQNLSGALQLINSDFTVAPENAKKLAEVYPELLSGAQVLADGTVQLSKGVYDEVVGEVKTSLSNAYGAYNDVTDGVVTTTQQQADAYTAMFNNATAASGEATEEITNDQKDLAKEYVKSVLEKERAAEQEAGTVEKLANMQIDAAAATAVATTTGLSEMNEAIKIVTENYVKMWKAGKGEDIDYSEMSSVAITNASNYQDFIDETDWVQADDVIAYLDDPNSYKPEDKNKDGSTDDEMADVIAWANLVNTQAQTDNTEGQEREALLRESEKNSLLDIINTGPTGDPDGDGGSKKDQEEKNALKEREEELSRQINEELEKAAPNYEKVNALMRERDNLQLNYLDNLKDEEALLEKNIQKQIDKNEEAGMSEYFNVEKDGETYTVVFTDKYADLTPEQKEKVDKYYAETVEIIAKDAVVQAEIDRLNKEGKVELSDGSWVDPDRAQKDYEAELNNTLEDQEDLERTLSGLQDDQVKNYPLILAYQARQIALKKKEVEEAKKLLELEKAKMKARMAAMDTDGYSKYAGYDLEKQELYYNSELIQQDLDSGAIDEGYVQNVDDYYESLKPGAESIDTYQDMVDDGNAEIQAMAEDMVNTAMEMVGQIVDVIVKVAEFISEIAAGIKDALLNAITEQDFWLENTFRRMEALATRQERLLTKNEQVQAGLLSTLGQTTGNYNERWNNLQKQYITAYNIVKDTESYLTEGLASAKAKFTSSFKTLFTDKYLEDKEGNKYTLWETLQKEDPTDSSVSGIEGLGEVDLDIDGWVGNFKNVVSSGAGLMTSYLTDSWTTSYNTTLGYLEKDMDKQLALDLSLGLMSSSTMLGPLADTLQTLQDHANETLEAAYDAHEEYTDKMLELEQQMLEMVKEGVEEATAFEDSVMEAYTAQKQAEIDELSRLNDSISNANSTLISTLQDNLSKMREERELDKTKEDISDKERRLAYLRQDTSGANKLEILKLEEELEDSRESYTDQLIDKKINELQEQNDKAAEQRQQQIDLLQSQLDYSVKYGLYWNAIYEMLEKDSNFSNGYVAKNSDLAKLLSTYGSTETLSKSIWGTTVAKEAFELAGFNYQSFIDRNGTDGVWELSKIFEDLASQTIEGAIYSITSSSGNQKYIQKQDGQYYEVVDGELKKLEGDEAQEYIDKWDKMEQSTNLYKSNLASALGISQQELATLSDAGLAAGAITASIVQGAADTVAKWLPVIFEGMQTGLQTIIAAINGIQALLQAGEITTNLIQAFASFIGGMFATGTPFLEQDTLALVHKGEMIIPARYNPENNPNIGLVSKGLLVGESAHTAAAQKNLTTQNNRDFSQNVNIIIEEINENVDVDMVIQKITDTLNSNLRYITNI